MFGFENLLKRAKRIHEEHKGEYPKRYVRNVYKMQAGNSYTYYICIPRQEVKRLGIKPKEPLEIIATADGLLIIRRLNT